MTDLTLLYYTANRIPPMFQEAVASSLVESMPEKSPMRIVSQRELPAYWGDGDWLEEVTPFQGASIYNCYRQILMAAKNATTPYVACCEDDSLYVPEHFEHRPALDAFGYNRHRWVLSRRLSADGRKREAFYYFRERTQMAQCIAPRELLIETLEEKFRKFPEPVPHDVAKKTGWGEPGRYEKLLGLTPRKLEIFRTIEPNVTINHTLSLMGRRQVQPTDLICDDLAPWGPAQALWNRIHG